MSCRPSSQAWYLLSPPSAHCRNALLARFNPCRREGGTPAGVRLDVCGRQAWGPPAQQGLQGLPHTRRLSQQQPTEALHVNASPTRCACVRACVRACVCCSHLVDAQDGGRPVVAALRRVVAQSHRQLASARVLPVPGLQRRGAVAAGLQRGRSRGLARDGASGRAEAAMDATLRSKQQRNLLLQSPAASSTPAWLPLAMHAGTSPRRPALPAGTRRRFGR